MTELQIINRQEVLGKDFKVYGTPDEPLFLAKDVAEWIEHSDSAKMIQNVDENEKVPNIVRTLGGNQTTWFLTEDGLYEVLMLSRKPMAKQFKAKVKEILKTIRKNGAYITEPVAARIKEDPNEALRVLERQNMLLSRRNEMLEAANEEKSAEIDRLHDDLDRERSRTMKCAIQATFFEAVMNTGDNITLTEAAKEIGCGRDELIDLCIRKKYLYRAKGSGRLIPMANRKAAGVFVVKEYKTKGEYKLAPQTYVTLPGRAKLLAECVKAGVVQPTLPDPLAAFWEV